MSPADTEWALGTVDDIDSLTFEPFRAATGGAAKECSWTKFGTSFNNRRCVYFR